MLVHAYYEEDPRVRREAEALVASGRPVDVLALRRPGMPSRDTLDGVTVHRLPVQRHQGAGIGRYLAEYAEFFARTATAAVRLHARRHYALVQVATLPDPLVFAVAPLRLDGVPVVLDLHEAMPEFFRSRFPAACRPWVHAALRAAERASIAFASHAITVNDALADRLRGLGVPRAKLDVVLNSPRTDRFDPASHPARPFMGGGVLRLVYAGALTPIYQIDAAIRAMALIRYGHAEMGGVDGRAPLVRSAGIAPPALEVPGAGVRAFALAGVEPASRARALAAAEAEAFAAVEAAAARASTGPVASGTLAPPAVEEATGDAAGQPGPAPAGEPFAITLDLYGRGDASDGLAALAAELGMADRVTFHGRIPIEDVPGRIALADAGLAPTRRDEFTDFSLSTKIFEYAAMGKPVLASRLPTVERYFGPDALCYYEPGDAASLAAAIRRLVDDPAWRQRTVDAAGDRVRDLSWDRESARYVALVERLISSPARPA